MYKALGRCKKIFRLSDLTQEDINEVLLHELCEKCRRLKSLQEAYAENRATNNDIARELMKAAYVSGIVGIKSPELDQVAYSYELASFAMPWKTDEEILSDSTFHIHKTFWSALGIHNDSLK